MKKSILLGLALMLCLSAFPQNFEQQADQLLTELFPADGPGGTAIVAQKGEIIYHKAFGKANLELDVDMQTDYIFRIGSVTKQFTACAILRLMEEGKLSLQDPVTKFIEDYPTHGYEITVEHLLTHTSGIFSYTQLEKWDMEEKKRDFTPLEMIDYFKSENMDFAPGTQWKYNNSGYYILGHIIEKLSGKSYAEYIETEFFEPLGMKNSMYDNFSNIIKGRADGYFAPNVNAAFLSNTQAYAAGSLLSNSGDLFKWYTAVMGGKVVSKESLKLAHTAYVLKDGRPTDYGFGWFLGNVNGSPMIQHSGGIFGYLTGTAYLPEEEVFVAILSNCNCHNPVNPTFKLAGMAIGKPYAYEPISLKKKELPKYVGVYESAEGNKRYISMEDGVLYYTPEGEDRLRLSAKSATQFFYENGLELLDFSVDKKGKVTELVSRSYRMPTTYKKISDELPKREVVELSPEQITPLLGEYELREGFVITIYTEGEKIMSVATNQDPSEVFPFAENKFFVKDFDGEMEFPLNEEGKVEKMILTQGKDTYTLKKIK
ncbi:MAG: serine hydrolase [Bacteroidota bacterium]